MSYMTVRDVADHFKVSTRTVQRLIDTGHIRAKRIGEKLLRVWSGDLPAVLPAPDRPSRPKTDLPLSGVYLLFLEGALTYVGRSTELPRRITNHRRAGREFDDVQAIPCEPAVADWLEAELVRTLRPPQNIKRFERRARRVEAGMEAWAP